MPPFCLAWLSGDSNFLVEGSLGPYNDRPTTLGGDSTTVMYRPFQLLTGGHGVSFSFEEGAVHWGGGGREVRGHKGLIY